MADALVFVLIRSEDMVEVILILLENHILRALGYMKIQEDRHSRRNWRKLQSFAVKGLGHGQWAT